MIVPKEHEATESLLNLIFKQEDLLACVRPPPIRSLIITNDEIIVETFIDISQHGQYYRRRLEGPIFL